MKRDDNKSGNFYCNRAEVRFKSALSNACLIKLNSGTFYLDKQSYTPSQGERDAKKRKHNIAFFNNHLYKDILKKEAKLYQDVRKYPELKEYRKGGNRQKNKLPVWVAFSYFKLGTVTMMYNYLRGDLQKQSWHILLPKQLTKREIQRLWIYVWMS